MFHALLPECFDVLCEDIRGDGMQDAVPAVLDVGDVFHALSFSSSISTSIMS